MSKRALESPTAVGPTQKRAKRHNDDRLSALSDELVLRILSFLEVSDLIVCHGVSHHLCTLSQDSSIWRLLYYRRFIKPRSSRMLKLSRWLHEHQSLTGGRQTDWKKRYKLSLNWSKGRCDIRTTQVSMVTAVPSPLVRMYKDLLITAQRTKGLEIWSASAEQELLLSKPWDVGVDNDEHDLGQDLIPTALTVDSVEAQPDILHIAVAFTRSLLTIYKYNVKRRTLDTVRRWSSPGIGAANMIAMIDRFLVLLYSGSIELHDLQLLAQEQVSTQLQPFPPPLASLRSHIPGGPMALNVRLIKTSVCVSFASVEPSIYHGWVAGMQETTWASDGTLLSCRRASSPQTGIDRDPFALPVTDALPTSLSYNHPYLLTAHADNTLTLFLVSSNGNEIRIGEGQRLWGHASSVAGALVNSRGKAISVTSKGGELRVWDLEGGGESMVMKKRQLAGDLSVRIAAESVLVGNPKAPSQVQGTPPSIQYPVRTGEWVDFDDEKVVVLRGQPEGSHDLVVYDFT